MTTRSMIMGLAALVCSCTPHASPSSRRPVSATVPRAPIVTTAPSSGPTRYGLAIVNSRGNVWPLSGIPEGLFLTDPALSPDGRRFVVAVERPNARGGVANVPGTPMLSGRGVAADGDVAVYDIATGQFNVIESPGREFAPAWLPDGLHISFMKQMTPVDSITTFQVQRADGSEPARQIIRSPLLLTTSTWFPDAARAVVAHSGTRTSFQGRLAIVAANNPDSLQTILAERYRHSSPALSPDGTMLAYAYSETSVASLQAPATTVSRIGIYRFSDGARVSPVPAGGYHPVWSSSGRTLFYQHNTGAIVKVELRDSNVLAISTPRPATPYMTSSVNSLFAVFPGDTTFLVRTELAPPRVVSRPVPAALRGRVASERDQRAIELVAVREAVFLISQLNRDFAKFALDMRAYRTPGAPAFAGLNLPATSAMIVAHTPAHMSDIARALRVAGTVSDSATCTAPRLVACRMRQYSGLVALSPAVVSADSALISFITAERASGAVSGEATGVSVSGWHLIVARAGNQWTVREVIRFP